MPQPLTEHAPAKVNLTLRVLGKRADGYHEIESLVAFARVGDELTLCEDDTLALKVEGPMAAFVGDSANNLVLRAANELAARVDGLRLGRFVLTKTLPVAAGLGGGSSDAAAALRLIARLNGIPLSDPRLMEAARKTGADVPVCLDPRPRFMRGIGAILSAPLELPELPAVLVNPGTPLATGDVFARLGLKAGEKRAGAEEIAPGLLRQRDRLLSYLACHPNDLEPAAIALAPVIAQVLAALSQQRGCQLARMSGSGATCFALFATPQQADAAAAALSAAHPAWWVRATSLGGG